MKLAELSSLNNLFTCSYVPQNKASCINIYAKETRRFPNWFCKGCGSFLHSSRPKPQLRQETFMKTKELFKTIVVNVKPKNTRRKIAFGNIGMQSICNCASKKLPPVVIKYNDIAWILNRITKVCVSVLFQWTKQQIGFDFNTVKIQFCFVFPFSQFVYLSLEGNSCVDFVWNLISMPYDKCWCNWF